MKQTTKTPFIPEGFTLISHQELDAMDMHTLKVELTGNIKGTMEDYFKGKTNLLNSNHLKWYLDNLNEIPDEWKGKWIYFGGTILQSPGGNRCVLFLYWDGGRWGWNYDWLDGGFSAGEFSASVASTLTSKLKPSLLESLELRVAKLEKQLKSKKHVVKII